MKRYVMLDDKEIIGTKDMQHYIATNIIKQSDNIIDLLEVGDMSEKIDMAGDTIIEEIRNQDDLVFDKDFYNQSPDLFTAIWKRNGDIMRRYEV